MNDPIPEPLSGKHVLDWAVPVTRALNALGDKIGATSRNERDRRAGVNSMQGCFELVKKTVDGVVKTFFENQFCMVGNILEVNYLQTTLEDLLPSAGDGEGTQESPKKLFVALELNALAYLTYGGGLSDESGNPLPAIVGFPSFYSLQSAQRNLNYHTIPLYLLDVVETQSEEGGDPEYSYTVKCDFRKGVFAQQWEMLDRNYSSS